MFMTLSTYRLKKMLNFFALALTPFDSKILGRAVLAGNDTFWTKSITQNRKIFITQSKHTF